MLVRYASPLGPRCFRCRIVRPSGPAAREFPVCKMAQRTISGGKGEAVRSSGCNASRRRLTRRVSGLEVWGTTDVNCLLKAHAISPLRVSVVSSKVIGWFGGTGERLPLRDLMILKNWEALYLCEQD